MKNKLKLFCLGMVIAVSAYAAVTTYNYPPATFDETQKKGMDAIFNLFVQKTGDTATGDQGITGGNLLINTAGKGIVIKEGANGRSGTIAFQTGVLTLISNTTVTATTRCFLQKTTTTAPTLNAMIATNAPGVGIQLIPSIAETNTYSFYMIEGQ